MRALRSYKICICFQIWGGVTGMYILWLSFAQQKYFRRNKNIGFFIQITANYFGKSKKIVKFFAENRQKL
jgi:hypothetical protein